MGGDRRLGQRVRANDPGHSRTPNFDECRGLLAKQSRPRTLGEPDRARALAFALFVRSYRTKYAIRKIVARAHFEIQRFCSVLPDKVSDLQNQLRDRARCRRHAPDIAEHGSNLTRDRPAGRRRALALEPAIDLLDLALKARADTAVRSVCNSKEPGHCLYAHNALSICLLRVRGFETVAPVQRRIDENFGKLQNWARL